MSADDAYTKLLLHMNGADTSTTFLDECGKTVTAVGNAQIDTAQSKFGGAAGLFDGTGDYLTVPSHADFQLDGGVNTNQWTIDLWLRFSTVQETGIFWGNNLDFEWHDSNNFRMTLGSVYSWAWTPSSGTWYHIACVKNGTTYYMFVNGSSLGTNTSTNVMTTGDTIKIGSRSSGFTMAGWFDEYRISKGIARWTSNFSVPTQEYSAGGIAVAASPYFRL